MTASIAPALGAAGRMFGRRRLVLPGRTGGAGRPCGAGPIGSAARCAEHLFIPTPGRRR